MSDHHHRRTIQRHCDVCVIGGSAAALAAALQLGALGLAVIVVAPDEPAPSDAEIREWVRGQGGEILAGQAVRTTDDGDGFTVELTGGHSVAARGVLDASAGTMDTAAATAVLVASLSGDGARSANERDWDQRYADRQMWSGNPNGTLVQEAGRLTPGRALDVGAGEGGDAIWLAEQGWHVVAGDIAEPALTRIAAEASRRGLDSQLQTLHADANGIDPFTAIGSANGGFDLVSAQYASIPRTPDNRGVDNLLNAVAPGGTLLVVSHDLRPMRTPLDTERESRIFDPDAYVRVEDFVAALQADPDWTIELNEMRPRPAGSATSHHVDDLVLRAKRH